MHLTSGISHDADRNASRSSPIPTGWRSIYLVVTYRLGRTVNEGHQRFHKELDLKGSSKDAEFDERHVRPLLRAELLEIERMVERTD
jgi:hypothetical protein